MTARHSDRVLSLPASMARRDHPVVAREVAWFLVTGAIATASQFSVLIALVEACHLDPLWATSAGYAVGGCVSYGMNRSRTFRSVSPHREAVWRFVSVASIGFALTALLMYVFIDQGHAPYLLAQAVTTGLVMVWSFTANKFWTFAVRPRRSERPN